MRPTAVIAMFFLSAGALSAGEADPGRQAYLAQCAGCHGASARGDGPTAALLTVPVPDLTHLSARNGGAFPMLEVIHIIDGRISRPGHDGPMPVFGDQLSGTSGVLDGPDGSPVFTRGIILSLAYYLESIQDGQGASQN